MRMCINHVNNNECSENDNSDYLIRRGRGRLWDTE